MLVTPDEQPALVVVDFWQSVSGHEVFERTTSLAEPYRGRPLDFYFAGEPMASIMEEEQSREIAWRIPLTFLVTALMLLFSFRTLQGMMIPMLTATLSTVWGLGSRAGRHHLDSLERGRADPPDRGGRGALGADLKRYAEEFAACATTMMPWCDPRSPWGR